MTASSGSYSAQLDVAAPLRMVVLRAAVAQLDLPVGSQGLDVGCGAGHVSRVLAEAVGTGGQVTGLDVDPALLATASRQLEQAGHGGRFAGQVGDANDLPFPDSSFDWAVSVDCLGYSPAVPMEGVAELARAVRPGGQVAVLAWSSERLLPGYPALEARLRCTKAGLAPFGRDLPPESDFLRGLGWFRHAGLVAATAHTFVGQVCAPLSADERTALAALVEMRWPGAATELPHTEASEFRRLCDPQSPDFIVDHRDYCAFYTYTMLCGVVADLRSSP